MSVLDWLQFLDGWRRANIEEEGLTIARGERVSLYRAAFEEGWVTSGIYEATDPDIEFELSVYEKGGFTRRLSVQPSYLFNLGIVNPNNIWPWCSVYDTVNNIYVIVYAPVRPWAFAGEVTCGVLLPSTASNASATISFIINRIKIVNKEAFLRSWRALTWGKLEERLAERVLAGLSR